MVLLGIYQIWTHFKYRNQGIATQLLNTIRSSTIIYGHVIPIHCIAFSSPTCAGVGLAKKYYGGGRSGGSSSRIMSKTKLTSKKTIIDWDDINSHQDEDDTSIVIVHDVLVYDC